MIWPRGNIRGIQRVANSLINATTTGDIANILGAFNAGLGEICEGEKFQTSRLVNGGCKSPEVELSLKPATCLLDPVTGSLTCRPAYLLLEQRPAECSLP